MKIFLLLLLLLLPLQPVAYAAIGNVVADCQDIATGARLDIQPGAGTEWIIHNIVFDANVTLERWDGTFPGLKRSRSFTDPFDGFFPFSVQYPSVEFFGDEALLFERSYEPGDFGLVRVAIAERPICGLSQ